MHNKLLREEEKFWSNKKGQIFWFLIIILGLVIVASVLGLVFVNKFTDLLGSKTTIILIIISLALVFHKFVEAVLLSLLAWIKSF